MTAHIIAVIMFLGRPAESSGVIPGDYIVTVNQVDVTSLTHFELISLIKQCGTEGDMALGIFRPSNEGLHLALSSLTHYLLTIRPTNHLF